MNGRMSLLFRNSLGVVVAIFAGLAAPMANAMDNRLATGVVRFALDTGEAEKVVGLAAKLEGESADYLRARLLLASGQDDKARAGFEGVFNGTSHRGEAALALAEMAQADGDLTGAENWYQQARRAGYGDVVQKALLGLAELARMQGKTDAAGQYLARMEDGYWAAVGYMNLAADFARDDLDSSRALVSLRVAWPWLPKTPTRIGAGHCSINSISGPDIWRWVAAITRKRSISWRRSLCKVITHLRPSIFMDLRCRVKVTTGPPCRAGTGPRNFRWHFPAYQMPGLAWDVVTIFPGIRARPENPGSPPMLRMRENG